MKTDADSSLSDSHWKEIAKGRDEILNVRSEVVRRQSTLPHLVDCAGRYLANPIFFLIAGAAHGAWLVSNLPVWPWSPWDPFPFTFLATATSIAGPFLALIILMHQRRDARIDELREEINLQVCLHLERESSMILRLLAEVQDHLGVASTQNRTELARMEEYLDPKRLMSELIEDLRRSEGNDAATSI